MVPVPTIAVNVISLILFFPLYFTEHIDLEDVFGLLRFMLEG